MSIYRDELITALKSVVQTDRYTWKEDSFDRAVNAALVALGSSRPNYADTELTLVSGQSRYPVPDDFIDYTGSDWANKYARKNLGGVVNRIIRPRIYSASTSDGKTLKFSFAPTPEHLAAYGSTFSYTYRTPHTLPASADDESTPCTIAIEDYEILLTFALSRLMMELTAANVTDPVQMHRGMGATIDYSGSPAKAHALLIKHYYELVCQ